MIQNPGAEQALIKIQHEWARMKDKSSWREICVDGYIYKTEWRMEGGRITSNPSLTEIIANDRQYSL
jgi:hypothetical protein